MLDFRSYIQDIRRRAIQKIVPYLQQRNIRTGLEVGAGDGFQSRILVNYLDKLIVTEYSKDRLQQLPNNKIEYLICDAEQLDKHFSENQFDLIFSSHLIEHLPNPERFLESNFQLIADKGIIVHTVPSNWFTLFRISLWYPWILVRLVRKLKRNPSNFNLLQVVEKDAHNNLKTVQKGRRKIFIFLIPKPHGISKNLISEYLFMRKRNWIKLFRENRLEIIQNINGSCFSGYGFGFKRMKSFFSRLGMASEYIFILRKRND